MNELMRRIERDLAMMLVCCLAGFLAFAPGRSFGQNTATGNKAANIYRMDLKGDSATFTTSRMIVVVRDGKIARVFNRSTGSNYISAEDDLNKQSQARSGLVYAEQGIASSEQRPDVIGPTLTKAGDKVLIPTLLSAEKLPRPTVRRVGPLSIEYGFMAEQGKTSLRIIYSLEPGTGDLTVKEMASGNKKGLSGIRWGLGPVVCRGNLLIPAFNGIKATRKEDEYKFEDSNWAWPTGWQIPLVIFSDKVGGFWVHSEDTALRFKEVMYEQTPKRNWQIAFTTVFQAPFAKYDSGESVVWHLNTFEGDWRSPVDRYKKWAYAAYRMQDKEQYRPKWVNEIKLVIKHADYEPEAEITHFLDTLQQHVVPSETLLFLTNWKSNEKAKPIPYWIPSERGIRFARDARRRGFRIMYFANYIGIMPNHPKFSEFEDHFIRDPYTGKIQGWNLEGEWTQWNLRGDRDPSSDVKLYYVNPGYKPWRDLQIEQFKKLFAMSPGDGLFLDQAFLIFNDGNGTVDGHTMVESNLEFHREIANALPGVALGGESINEITMQYESFCELHFLSLDLKNGEQGEPIGWRLEPGAFDRMVPLVTRFVEPHTRPMGYVGFPETSSPYYEAWRDALHVYGGIPTLTKPTVQEMEDGQGEVRRVMRQAFPSR